MGAYKIAPKSNWVQTVGALAVAGSALLPSNLTVGEPGYLFPSSQLLLVPAKDWTAGLTSEDYSVDTGIIALRRSLTRSRSRWFNYVTRRLSELASGGLHSVTMTPRPSVIVCDRALRVAENAFHVDTPTPSVVVAENGNVLFVWRSAEVELEIEIGIEETEVWAYDRPGGMVWSGQLEERQAEFFGLLDSIERA